MLGICFYNGSRILVSGTAGTGKTSIAISFADAACRRNQSCLYCAFEESPKHIIRNAASIGVNLEEHVKNGLLHFHSSRPTLYGLEMHLVQIYKLIKEHKPEVVILDPITNLTTVGSVSQVKTILIRLIDFLQTELITVMFTALTLNNVMNDQTDEGVSSLVDAWLLVRDVELGGERNKGMYIMKSRGMKHSNQIREFVITDNGLDLVDVFLSENGILIGSAREAEQLKEQTGELLRDYRLNVKDREILRRRKVLESEIARLQTEFESTEEELNTIYKEDELKKQIARNNREEMTRIRSGNQDDTKNNIE